MFLVVPSFILPGLMAWIRRNMTLKATIISLALTILLLGCEKAADENESSDRDRDESTIADGQAGTLATRGWKPTTALTRTFYGKIVSKQPGDRAGRVELRDTMGILIHPGDTKPTSVTFQLDGKYKNLDILFFIANLGAGGRFTGAGTVNVQAYADGRSLMRNYVDRHSDAEMLLDVSGARQLTITVDNGDGQSLYDWLFMSVEAAN